MTLNVTHKDPNEQDRKKSIAAMSRLMTKDKTIQFIKTQISEDQDQKLQVHKNDNLVPSAAESWQGPPRVTSITSLLSLQGFFDLSRRRVFEMVGFFIAKE